jgi:hypothetical protein
MQELLLKYFLHQEVNYFLGLFGIDPQSFVGDPIYSGWVLARLSLGYRWVIAGLSLGYRWVIVGLSLGYRFLLCMEKCRISDYRFPFSHIRH